MWTHAQKMIQVLVFAVSVYGAMKQHAYARYTAEEETLLSLLLVRLLATLVRAAPFQMRTTAVLPFWFLFRLAVLSTGGLRRLRRIAPLAYAVVVVSPSTRWRCWVRSRGVGKVPKATVTASLPPGTASL